MPYDHLNGPEPRYFQQILENSLEKQQVQQLCEDFINLLKYNQKSHKQKVWLHYAFAVLLNYFFLDRQTACFSIISAETQWHFTEKKQ